MEVGEIAREVVVSFYDTLPSGSARDTAILSAIVSGMHEPIVWAPIHSGEITLWVAEDALKIEGVRVSVSHRLAQQIADHLDARLPTTKISDLVFEQAAVRFNAPPQPWFSDGSMAANHRLVEYSAKVDNVIAGRTGLAACVGKDWVLSRVLHDNVAANYGFHYRKCGRTMLWQSLGTAHNIDHHDYSQNLRLVCRTCEAEGQRVPIDNVLRSTVWARLVSSEGPLPFLRHPGVPYAAPDAPLGDP